MHFMSLYCALSLTAPAPCFAVTGLSSHRGSLSFTSLYFHLSRTLMGCGQGAVRGADLYSSPPLPPPPPPSLISCLLSFLLTLHLSFLPTFAVLLSSSSSSFPPFPSHSPLHSFTPSILLSLLCLSSPLPLSSHPSSPPPPPLLRPLLLC